jgi:ankyrin repeat protein
MPITIRSCALLLAWLCLWAPVAGCRLTVDTRRGRNEDTLRDLFAAVETGQQARVSQLLERHPDWINARSELDNCVLFVAAYHGQASVARVLIDAGADLDEGGSAEMAPLHAATVNNHLEVLRLLLDAGAKVDVRDAWGRTPLHYAAGEGHTEAAEALIASGADRAVTDSDGQTPLDAARNRRHGQMVDLLTRAAHN